MIKTLSGIFSSMESDLQLICDKYMYDNIQSFTNLKIGEYYSNALKKKKPISASLKFATESLKDTEKTNRYHPFSFSQIHFAKASLSLICDDRLKLMKGGLLKEKNFSSSQVTDLGIIKTLIIVEKFFRFCILINYISDIHGTAKKSSDLSMLWFKEFYLELSRKVQFPISTSLPWILTEYALESNKIDDIQ